MPKKTRTRGQAMPSRSLPHSLPSSPLLQSFFDGYNASPVDRASAISRASSTSMSNRIRPESKPLSVSQLKNLVNRLKHGSSLSNRRKTSSSRNKKYH